MSGSAFTTHGGARQPRDPRRNISSSAHCSSSYSAGAPASKRIKHDTAVAMPALPLTPTQEPLGTAAVPTADKCTSCPLPITHKRHRKCSCGLWSDESFCKRCVKLGTWVCAQCKVVDLT
jgi:hypothetical protein